VADIQDDDEGRIFVTRQGADVALGLAARLQHRLAPSVGAAHGLGVFLNSYQKCRWQICRS